MARESEHTGVQCAWQFTSQSGAVLRYHIRWNRPGCAFKGIRYNWMESQAQEDVNQDSWATHQ